MSYRGELQKRRLGMRRALDESEDFATGFDANEVRARELEISSLLDSRPPNRDYMFRDTQSQSYELPLGIAGIVSADGGTGKTLVLLQLAIAAAAGLRWLRRFEATKRRHVYFFTAEDDSDEVHRRLAAVVQTYSDEKFDSTHFPSVEKTKVTGRFSDEGAVDHPLLATSDAISGNRDWLCRNLHIFPVVGTSFPVTEVGDTQECFPGSAVDFVIERVLENDHFEPPLIILDPLRKMTAGREDGQSMTAIVSAMDRIRTQVSDATVIAAHHTSKLANRSKEVTADASRGATDLVDGVRWAAIMTAVNDKRARDLALEEDPADYRELKLAKSNYGPLGGSFLLKYVAGSFQAVDIDLPNEDQKCLGQLVAYLQKVGAAPMRELRECSAKHGRRVISCSKNRTSDFLVPEAIRQELIEECQDPNRKTRYTYYRAAIPIDDNDMDKQISN